MKNLKKNNLDNLRYEKKWIINSNNSNEILNYLYRSRFNFTEHYKDRRINSIYFDDKNLISIKDNLEGNRDRCKIRLRWYGSNQLIKNPVLEYKIKKGLISKKNKIKIKSLNGIKIKNNTDINKILIEVKKCVLNKSIIPIILISYNRKYFISSNKMIRATFDENIYFKKLKFFYPEFYSTLKKKIIEIKYPMILDNYVRKIISNVPSRYAKSSKYVMCMLENSKEFTLNL